MEAARSERGLDFWLGGLEYWLDKVSETGDLVYSTGKDPAIKSWPLQTFLTSPNGALALEKVAPYEGQARGEALIFLVDSQIKPNTVSRWAYEALSWLNNNGLAYILPELYEKFDKAKHTFSRFLAEFVGRYDVTVLERHYLNKLTEGLRAEYRPFQEQLLTEERNRLFLERQKAHKDPAPQTCSDNGQRKNPLNGQSPKPVNLPAPGNGTALVIPPFSDSLVEKLKRIRAKPNGAGAANVN
jgi:hypothetical protein